MSNTDNKIYTVEPEYSRNNPLNTVNKTVRVLNKKKRVTVQSIVKYVVLICIAAALLFPVIYMVTNSFMSNSEVLRNYNVISSGGIDNTVINDEGIEETKHTYISFKLIPDMVSFMQYYNVLLRKPKFLLMFWNSVFLTVPIVVGQIIVATLAAYAFSKLKFPFSDKIFFIYIIVMMMPFQVTLVPNYIVLKELNLLGSYWSIIFPGTFATFGVFLLRQFMVYIPDEYCESAKIDGAGYMRSFFSIVLPQCKGALASLAILVFIDNWNMVEQPLIFLDNETMHPLSIFLSRINEQEIGIAFACGMLYMIPTLLVFLYGENYFIEGIEMSGVK
ncbi:carbohydrate ABC transporter permease [Ruminiclostridium herbifermentans]|uniref:Carbohydrate ABC transporter permease n=1 Tax=Ruminiclostridium herbifermentans TaxID=2488810 RepID=A0A4U7JJA0_9FIRM|nr:carbohydrate ABC transporter permease [Ruminiclostridium herbifermentans]QNU67342.1 carbohydrate ABC transporter permease [Ruminiclostridium herbifermentans]